MIAISLHWQEPADDIDPAFERDTDEMMADGDNVDSWAGDALARVGGAA